MGCSCSLYACRGSLSSFILIYFYCFTITPHLSRNLHIGPPFALSNSKIRWASNQFDPVLIFKIEPCSHCIISALRGGTLLPESLLVVQSFQMTSVPTSAPSRELSNPPSDGISNLRFSNHSDHLLVSSWDKVRSLISPSSSEHWLTLPCELSQSLTGM